MGIRVIDAKVDVYFNLHRKLWSLRDRKTGKVLEHARVVAFSDAVGLVVQPAGRARVVRTGIKDIHAFVRGAMPEVTEDVEGWKRFAQGLPDVRRVTYNPMKAAHFYDPLKGPHTPLKTASCAVLVAPEGEAPEVWAIAA